MKKFARLYLVFVFALLYLPIFYLMFYSFNQGGDMNGFTGFTLEHFNFCSICSLAINIPPSSTSEMIAHYLILTSSYLSPYLPLLLCLFSHLFFPKRDRYALNRTLIQ